MYLERRHNIAITEIALNELTIAQELILLEAFQIGFSLTFTRKLNNGVLAIANKGTFLMAITPNGITQLQPDIKIR